MQYAKSKRAAVGAEIFNEEDLNALENGYSVSETDASHLNENDIISLRSGLSGGIALSSPVQER